jgi:hypothetical protein
VPVSLRASEPVGGPIDKPYIRVGEVDLSLHDARAMAGILLALVAVGWRTAGR